MGNKNGVPVLRDEDIQHLKQSSGMEENQVVKNNNHIFYLINQSTLRSKKLLKILQKNTKMGR